MKRAYSKELTKCAGTCGRMVKPRTCKTHPDTPVRHAKGMCWSCYSSHFDIQRRPVETEKIQQDATALEGFLAARRRRLERKTNAHV